MYDERPTDARYAGGASFAAGLDALARWLAALALLAGALIAAQPALAASLSIGLASEFRSFDPHRAATRSDSLVASHVYESLVGLDGDSAPTPALATSWTQPELNTWQFNLRRDVLFHDGTRMTSEDVAASIKRAIQLRPAVLLGGKPEWLTVEVINARSVRVRAAPNYAFAMQALSSILIGSATSLKAFDAGSSGHSVAGSGPYRLSRMQPDRVHVEINKQYWGRPARWASVSFHALPESETRIAALQSGEMDAIERLPLDRLRSFRSDKRFTVHLEATGRLMYLQLGTHRANPPYVISPAPSEQVQNPLLDRRVRRAISQAIDRIELTKTVLQGLAEPAGQLVPPRYFGHVANLYSDKRDLADAVALLGEAGFPHGFSLTLHGPQDVYPGDVAVLSAVARMLTESGIKATAVSEPAATFAGRGSRQQYSAYLRGFSGTLRDASEYLVALLATHDATSGSGSLNWARYSNGTLDGMLHRAITQPRTDARNLMLQEATRLAMNDVALIPLYFLHDAWVGRGDLAFRSGTGPLLVAERIDHRPLPK